MITRNKNYLDFVRSLPCCKCGRPGPSDPHHVRSSAHAGIGIKPSDTRSIPLCGGISGCHQRLHSLGERRFLGEDMFYYMAITLEQFVIQKCNSKEGV